MRGGQRKPMSPETRRKIGKRVSAAHERRRMAVVYARQLDEAVAKAEALPKGDRQRVKLMRQAEEARKQLRRVDH